MAHFARLNENNVVIDIHVVDNINLLDENNVEQELLGKEYLKTIWGEHKWVQCSYNSNFRGMYPGIGFWYLEDSDRFIAPRPYPSWTLDGGFNWQSPVAPPALENNQSANWDEENQAWVITTIE